MAPKQKRSAGSLVAKAPLKRIVERDLLPATRKLPEHLCKEDSCGACLLPVEHDAQVGFVDGCKHFFHYECIERWSQSENSCPQCKLRFFWLAAYAPKGQRESLTRIQHRDQEEAEQAELSEDLQTCEKCRQVGDEQYLLLCDGMHGTCNAAFHCACVGLSAVPRESWFCQDCVERGFDIDSSGHRGNVTPVAVSSGSSATPTARPGASPAAPLRSAEAIAAAMRPALATAAVAAVTARRSSTAGATMPPQLRLSSLACLTSAAEGPSFRVSSNSSGIGPGGSAPERDEPAKESVFATFAARRRAQQRRQTDTSSTPSFALNPEYEDDFMGKSVN